MRCWIQSNCLVEKVNSPWVQFQEAFPVKLSCCQWEYEKWTHVQSDRVNTCHSLSLAYLTPSCYYHRVTVASTSTWQVWGGIHVTNHINLSTTKYEISGHSSHYLLFTCFSLNCRCCCLSIHASYTQSQLRAGRVVHRYRAGPAFDLPIPQAIKLSVCTTQVCTTPGTYRLGSLSSYLRTYHPPVRSPFTELKSPLLWAQSAFTFLRHTHSLLGGIHMKVRTTFWRGVRHQTGRQDHRALPIPMRGCRYLQTPLLSNTGIRVVVQGQPPNSFWYSLTSLKTSWTNITETT